ncbi:uncharacterized protein LOC110284037 [Mus caroli]|uniref:Uncharacterized protein LOC110284037 n=1 Tax=Mus caroli TaxID=10089 RepID=A0A6P5NWK0_MUSCR|nr:uncharacterized protein LOC110284037 [Mus caroli]
MRNLRASGVPPPPPVAAPLRRSHRLELNGGRERKAGKTEPPGSTEGGPETEAQTVPSRHRLIRQEQEKNKAVGTVPVEDGRLKLSWGLAPSQRPLPSSYPGFSRCKQSRESNPGEPRGTTQTLGDSGRRETG